MCDKVRVIRELVESEIKVIEKGKLYVPEGSSYTDGATGALNRVLRILNCPLVEREGCFSCKGSAQ